MPTRYNEETFKKYRDLAQLKTPREQKRIGGTLENWYVGLAIVSKPTDSKEYVSLHGELHNDLVWYPEGQTGPMHTSLLIEINDDMTEAETLNTIYKLGKPKA